MTSAQIKVKVSLSQFYVPQMTSAEIREALADYPAIIVPLCSTEPCTLQGTLGASALSNFELAKSLSQKKRIILSPMIPYGYSIAYRTFAGCGVVSERTMRSVVIDLLKSWASQSITTFIIVDGVYENNRIVKDAVHWIQVRNPAIKVCVLNWQQRKDVRSFIVKAYPGKEYGRSELGILSMAAYLDKAFVRLPTAAQPGAVVDEKIFQKWQKMGRDPEKFKKLFPEARTSSVSHECNEHFGENLFNHICEVYEKTLKQELNI